MTYQFVVAILALMNVAQMVFWSFHNHKLVNKLMSRNFGEYQLIAHGPPEIKQEAISFDEYEEQHEEDQILSELNGVVRAKI